MENVITLSIADLETLAAQLEESDSEKRAKLARLISAEARILSQRSPELFRKMATEIADADGHWDSSFPPKQVAKNRTGPRLLEIEENKTSDVATSSGFYFDWKRVTEDRGVYIDRLGRLWGCEETGTGRLGQFAAHPGDCDVEVELDWVRLGEKDISTESLELAEKTLREKLAAELKELGYAA